MSAWWLLALVIPYLGVAAALPVSIGVARRFDRGTGFGVCLWLLPFVFYPILAFSRSPRVTPLVTAHGRS
jgi:hypothetical protein